MEPVGIAVVFLYDKDKKVLMQHRDEKAKFYPSYWGCFGGHMEKGETPEDALRRELIEELEYKINRPTLLTTTEHFDKNQNRKIITYNFIEQYDETQKLVQHEGQGLGWFATTEALQLKVTELRRQALLKVQEFLEKI